MLTHFKGILREGSSILSIIIFSGVIFALFYAGTIERENKPTPPEKPTHFTTPVINPLITIKPETGPVKIEGRVKRGDTIINILKKHGIGHLAAHRFFMDVKPVYDLKRIKAGQGYTLFLSPDNQEKQDKETKENQEEIQRFIYKIDLDRYLEVTKDKPGSPYNAKLVTIPYRVKREFITGEIQESLFASILEAGEKPELADVMASLYEYDIDFNRDIRKKDSFGMMVEKMYLKGQFVRYGSVLGAEFTNRGKTIRVVRYTDPEGKTSYYHPDGRSVRKMFLRCPLPFMRVTSRYGNRRHPVLGYSARHNGIDLAAPRGTKVRTTASGIIIRAGYDRGKGRHILIRHNNRYVTNYYHLSRIHKGIKPGVRVVQGQLIGYVGKTGLA
ncbi:MAG: M23 family metallopeptidase, partial [bacterium]|nr:M23 family metallopeptidase [bacterium]